MSTLSFTIDVSDICYENSSHSDEGRTGPDGSSVATGACNLGVPGSNPGRDGYLSTSLCIYRTLEVI